MYMYICMCAYICMFICVCICLSLCRCWDTLLYKSYLLNCLSCRYLGCYLSVRHGYLGSNLSFSFEFLNLNTTTCTKSST